jgi:hypothetical protein
MAMSDDKPLCVYAPVSVKVGHLVEVKYQSLVPSTIHSGYFLKGVPHKMVKAKPILKNNQNLNFCD